MKVNAILVPSAEKNVMVLILFRVDVLEVVEWLCFDDVGSWVILMLFMIVIVRYLCLWYLFLYW
jgi:hypothetical protein